MAHYIAEYTKWIHLAGSPNIWDEGVVVVYL